MSKLEKLLSTSQLVWGIVLTAVGVFLLMQNLDFIYVRAIWKHWPALILIIGMSKLIGYKHQSDIADAFWWLFVGSWCYMSVFHIYDFTFRNSWPVLLIGLGIQISWKSLICKDNKRSEEL